MRALLLRNHLLEGATEIVSESVFVRPALLPFGDTYPYLSRIDLYADTVFNRIQLEAVLGEWNRIPNGELDEEDRECLRELKKLAEQASERELLLLFDGD